MISRLQLGATLLLLSTLTGACTDTSLEERKVVVTQSGPSCDRFLGKQGDGRFYRYDVDLAYGKKPPKQLLERDGGTFTKAWVHRSVDTMGVDSKPVGWAKGWYVVTIVLLVLGGIAIARTLIQKLYDDRKLPRISPARFWSMLIAGLAVIFAAGLTGLWAGSPVVIDNASNETVDVYINGKRHARLGPQRFLRTRIGGHAVRIEIRKDGQMVERIKAHPDRSIDATIRRAFIGNGAYLYNICGINRLNLDKAVYGKE